MDSHFGSAWQLVVAAAAEATRLSELTRSAGFALNQGGDLRSVPTDDPAALLIWQPGRGWEAMIPPDDPRRPLIDLYLPICSATVARPVTVGHLGQSLDGFIATHAGESRWVTGEENMRHMHRLRALCDAVIVGAGTIAADDPQLTTRLVEGPNPLRVVLDPSRRLGEDHRVFSDPSAETLYICARSLARANGERFGLATVIGVGDDDDAGVPVAEVVKLLRARGCARLFVEGGGVTVSMFLQAKQLDRLHVAIAPLLIGDGRPAIRLQPPDALGDCHRPRYRVFRMGADVLFDCDLRSGEDQDRHADDEPAIARVI
jgi:diaminohydroxyphosphoribosylaminopyrimidine deaminase / 5-amino-6-(5-phosphoribosylamino)uracil reductase